MARARNCKLIIQGGLEESANMGELVFKTANQQRMKCFQIAKPTAFPHAIFPTKSPMASSSRPSKVLCVTSRSKASLFFLRK